MWMPIDIRSPVPAYQQIKISVKEAIVTGRLKENDTLPSIREMAQEMKINPNTVARAYRDLEQEGIILPKQGIGNIVIVSPVIVRQSLIEELVGELSLTMTKLKKTGIQFQEFAKVVAKVWESI
ncbi:MAG: GntR family transcriptional regulator [Thermotogaceae bacterium]|nr:GntR family transcriptional regulator [Thermotogota bacterium]NLZ13267.1 GntR family transcriptional regulator [Thermotogaceae bacterium]